MDIEQKLLDEKLKDALLWAQYIGKAEIIAAKRLVLPVDCASWLDDIEAYAATLSNETPQKAIIPRFAQLARAALEKHDEPDLRLQVLRLSKLIEDAKFNEIVKKHRPLSQGGKVRSEERKAQYNQLRNTIKADAEITCDEWQKAGRKLVAAQIAREVAKEYAAENPCPKHDFFYRIVLDVIKNM